MLVSQKKKCQTDTTRCNTEYKASTVLITDLDTDTQPIDQAGGPPTLHKWKKFKKKSQRIDEQANSVTHILQTHRAMPLTENSETNKSQRDRDKQTLSNL